MDVRKSIPKLVGILAFIGAIAYFLHIIAAEDGRSLSKVIFAAWLFKAFTLLIAASLIFGNRLLVRISPEGLFAPRISNTVIPWRDIASAEIMTQNHSKHLAITLAAGSPSEQALGARQGLQLAAASLVGMNGFHIPLSIATARVADIETALREAQTARRPSVTRGKAAAAAPRFGRTAQAPRGFGRA